MNVTALFFSSETAARASVARGDQVFTSGFRIDGAEQVDARWGAAVHDVVLRARHELLFVDVPEDQHAAFLAPLETDRADVICGRRSPVPFAERAVNTLARLAMNNTLDDASCRARAFRVEVLKAERFTQLGDEAEAEVLVKLAAQQYRFESVDAPASRERSILSLAALTRTFGRYATVQDDADAQHEGYSNLAKLEVGAPNYNTWLAETFDRWAGQRVLEIGAGIGTITSRLAAGRELVTAFELDDFYVRRLRNRFRGQSQVEPYQGDVGLADWKGLASRNFDSIVLSNVLEHIPDDVGAVQTFARILKPGGTLILYVPAIEQLFGSLDESVGHHRRYTPQSLRRVLTENGFDVEHLQWMNLVGLPGWFLNGTVLKRRVLPPLQLRVFDVLAPTLARLEAQVRLPVGLSLFAVGRRRATAPGA